jgi:hypothetical protein
MAIFVPIFRIGSGSAIIYLQAKAKSIYRKSPASKSQTPESFTLNRSSGNLIFGVLQEPQR